MRDADGLPVVLRNAPLLDDGTPMPTRYWLIGPRENTLVGRLESTGAIDEVEAELGLAVIAEAHARYAAERDSALPADHEGPTPSGGVGGTRAGVKCLHAHYAWYLAGGDDPVGHWVADRLAIAPRRTSRRDRRDRSRIQFGEVARPGLGRDSPRRAHRGDPSRPRGRRHRRARPEAIERTLAALQGFVETGRELGVDGWRVVATSACRDAANRDEFLDAVERLVGTRPRLISGADEGRLAFHGALASLGPEHGERPTIVFDIGGGSTELMYGTRQAPPSIVGSFDVGAVRLRERELHHDPPRPEELTNAIGAATDELDDLVRAHPELLDASSIVGIGGTVRVAAAVELGLAAYRTEAVHGFRFTRDAAEDVFRTLATEALADRIHNPGLPEDRADIIVGGMCVLVAVLRRLHATSIVVSGGGILEALVAGADLS
ncbi:MAG: DUF501 domain-containing protein [Ilumatobacteraceae bacterium]